MPEESLISSAWYRVSEIKPKLRSHAKIHRHTYRGDDWYVLQDKSSGRFHRFSPEAYYVIGQMDGTRSLNAIWEAACERLGDDVPTQDEMISLLSQLHRADVLQADVRPDIADLEERTTTFRRRQMIGYIRSPVSLRFPLFDPERLLERTQGVASWVFGWVGGLVWALVVIPALVLAIVNWQALSQNVTDQVFGAQNLMMIGLLYPAIKIVHEFGHAYAVKRWGGEVHEMGIMLLVFVPIPYVDASESTAFSQKWQRVLVDAAGILVELFLAGAALFIWLLVEPGTIRAICFNVMLIASVSTLLFNGNPLLRFDAYYVLADALEIPNMGQRANQYLGFLFQRWVVGNPDGEDPGGSTGERIWLGVYGVAALIYRIFVIVAIVMIAASRFFFFGVVVALWTIVGVVGTPLTNAIKKMSAQSPQNRNRTLSAVFGMLAVVTILVFAVPVTLFTSTEGVLSPPEGSGVFAGTPGVVNRVLAEPGQTVRAGDPLVLVENDELAASVARLEAELEELETRHRAALSESPTQAEIVREEMVKVRGELQRAQEDLDDLTIRSPGDGVFYVMRPEDLPGRFLMRGSEIGYVVDPRFVRVRAVVWQDDVANIRKRTHRVDVRLSGDVERVRPAVILREVPMASQELPSLALSLEGGGSVALDPGSREAPRAFEPLFQFEVAVEGLVNPRIGERVYLRFEHDPEPIGFRWYRAARRLLLGQFGV